MLAFVIWTADAPRFYFGIQFELCSASSLNMRWGQGMHGCTCQARVA